MPRIVPLSEVLEMSADEPIICVRGTLKKVHKPKTGTNAKGEWSLQNAILEQDGTEVPLFLKDRQELSGSWQGRQIEIQSHKGEKGWSGCYAMDDDYGGKNTRKIKVTPTGIISLVEGGGGQHSEEPPAKPQQQAPAKTQQPAQNPATGSTASNYANTPHDPKHPGTAADLAEVVASANQLANLQLLCFATVEEYVAVRYKLKTGKDMDEAAKNSAAMNMAIELERKGMQWKMPTTRVQPRPQQPAPTPPPAPAPKPEEPLPPGATGRHPETGEPVDADGNLLF